MNEGRESRRPRPALGCSVNYDDDDDDDDVFSDNTVFSLRQMLILLSTQYLHYAFPAYIHKVLT
jgi:hypothetical protein